MTQPTGHFQTDHLNADLKGRSVRGGAVTLVSQVCKFLLGTGSTMILARLLTPQDYGLVGMVTAVTGFAVVFKDLGLSTATIQRAEINHQQVSTLFWLNTGLGFLISVVIAALAPAIAWFYHEPRLTGIGLALASLYFVSGLTTQHQALLQRQMRFLALAVVEVTALAIGILVGIGLAWAGWKYWTLVWMAAAQSLVGAVGTWVACRWRPGRPSRTAGIRSMLAYGGNITVVDFLSFLTRNLDNVLLGRYWGSQVLAFYAKAYQLLLMPIQQINAPIRGVAISALSRLQNDPTQFCNFYLKTVSLITSVTLPMIALFILLADEIILVVLGPQWREVAGMFRWLGIAALPQPMMNTVGWLYVAGGQTSRMMRWACVSAATIITAFFLGLPFGGRGVAACYAGAVILLCWPSIWYATRGTTVKVGRAFATAGRPALAVAVAMLPACGLKFWLHNHLPPLGLILLCSLVMALGYCWFIVAILKMKEHYISLLTHFRKGGITASAP